MIDQEKLTEFLAVFKKLSEHYGMTIIIDDDGLTVGFQTDYRNLSEQIYSTIEQIVGSEGLCFSNEQSESIVDSLYPDRAIIQIDNPASARNDTDNISGESPYDFMVDVLGKANLLDMIGVFFRSIYRR